MASYEELKARVAMLKRADKEESKSRKAREAKEAAEVARCASRIPLARPGGKQLRLGTHDDDPRTRLTPPSSPLSPPHAGPRLRCSSARRRTTSV